MIKSTKEWAKHNEDVWWKERKLKLNKHSVLVKEYPEYIRSYGLLSDLTGKTVFWGLTQEEVDKWEKDGYVLDIEFESNPELEKYIPFGGKYGRQYNPIDRGWLRIYALKEEDDE